jgi:hypothetical protein
MIPLLADENFNNQIVRGILRRNPKVDIVRIQDMGMTGVDDPTVLEWAAQQRRVVLTHDVATMTNFAYERVQAGLAMPGLFEVSRRVPIGLAIEEILLIAECSKDRRMGRTSAIFAFALTVLKCCLIDPLQILPQFHPFPITQ